jgi:hypothetical protein
MKKGSKVRILIGSGNITGIVTRVRHVKDKHLVDVQLKNETYPRSYWGHNLKEIKPKPLKLKQFSAWK